MIYQAAIDFLYSQLPMYQRQGKTAFKKDLTNIKLLSNEFENPERSFPSIHIAGTNGKGTVAHMLSAIFQSAGLRVGLYTSPHYKDFRERIMINGSYISKRKVSSFVSKVQAQIDTIRPSFFEITVVMAFDHFRNEQVDLAIIETGLGGRLDSTNIIMPVLSIITNISLDHQSMLGNTLRKIAKEKAGIIKKGVSVLVGEKQSETTAVFKKVAEQKKSKIYYAIDIVSEKKVETNDQKLRNPYEQLNNRTSRAAISIWNQEQLGKQISEQVLEKGIKNYRLISNYIGRWQVLDHSPIVIADSAHNEGGVSLLIKQLLEKNQPTDLHFVVGFVKDKPLDKVLRLFPDKAHYYFTRAKIPRALSPEDLKNQAGELGLKGKVYKTAKGALRSAKRNATANETVVICGSIFIIGEVI